MPITRNARGVDIAYSPDGKRFMGVQVKALSRAKPPVPLGTTLNKMMSDLWVIVTDAQSNSPVAFAMTPQEVKERVHRGKKDGRVSYWLC